MATAEMKTILNSGDSTMEPLLSVEQVARILGRSHWMLRLDAKAGRIRFVRIGRALMIEPSEVRRIMSEGLASSGEHTSVLPGAQPRRGQVNAHGER